MPFTLQPAQGEDFVNRDKIVKEMCHTLSDSNSRMGFALYGVRRAGKTSIIKEVCRRLAGSPKIVPIYFSLWDMVEGSLDEFVKALSVAVLDGYREKISLRVKAKNLLKLPLEVLKDLMRDLKVDLKIQDAVEILLSSKKQKMPEVERVFLLPEELARQTKTRCVLFLDEFPAIIDLKYKTKKTGEGIIRKIRTLSEDYKNTVLCISGSIKKTMSLTLLAPTSAFYRQFIVREILPLEKEEADKIILHNLNSPIDKEALAQIFNLSGGIPFYLQFWGKSMKDLPRVNLEDVERIIERFLVEEGNIIFKGEFEHFGPKERKILVASAQIDKLKPSEVARQIGESPDSIRKYFTYLEEKGALQKENCEYTFSDPVFRMWLKRKFA